MTELLPHLQFDRARLAAAAGDPELYATDRAERMVARGVPFRAAHVEVARSYAEAGTNAPAAELGEPGSGRPLENATGLDPLTEVGLRASPGGPAPSAVDRQCATARARLTAHRASLSSLGRKVALIEELLNEEKR